MFPQEVSKFLPVKALLYARVSYNLLVFFCHTIRQYVCIIELCNVRKSGVYHLAELILVVIHHAISQDMCVFLYLVCTHGASTYGRIVLSSVIRNMYVSLV